MALAAAPVLTGCPAQFGVVEGPGASGTVGLAQGVTSAGYRTLVLRAAPDTPLNPAKPSFPPSQPLSGTAAELVLRQGQSLSLGALQMPYHYALGGDYGTTPTARWRLYAWLTHGDGGDPPVSGDPYGTVTFELAPCPTAPGFCHVAGGVDVTIDSVTP